MTLLHAPPYAVVNETVNLARSMQLHTGLTNGVLRSVARAMDRLPEPDTGNSIRDLAIRWSHPTWLTRRYVQRFGRDEAIRLLAMQQQDTNLHYSRVPNACGCAKALGRTEFERSGIARVTFPGRLLLC